VLLEFSFIATFTQRFFGAKRASCPEKAQQEGTRTHEI
jgi:hypothetical protein